ncbi:hypothetical protein IZ6_25560 [Terrihabitans soli]|uniref:Uncharacterized protein n=1 Tax=Terrihabitans soli TaxID=708113 RepID=A0A6S6QXR1_9HYPH|nr:hypothetical protein [Terrihabitans soli]BCJ91821.1 hypothetical protein IZ6_25560 [Terrihabitans soli]
MSIYLIEADDVNGDSLNLFIRANTPEQAVELWNEARKAADWEEPFGRATVVTVPDEAGPIGAIRWEEMVYESHPVSRTTESVG